MTAFVGLFGAIGAAQRYGREIRKKYRLRRDLALQLSEIAPDSVEAVKLKLRIAQLDRELTPSGPTPHGKKADQMTRQRRRHELRARAYRSAAIDPDVERYKADGFASRQMRRSLARAFAARKWKEQQGLPIAA